MTDIPTLDKHPDTVVIFESGLGAAHTFWGLVQQRVAEYARTVVYCRAGYGSSDIDTELRSVARMAEDLQAVVAAATSERPSAKVILVGHSLGAAIVTQLAADFGSQLVAGLVLVDGVWADIPALRRSAYHRSLRLYSFGVQALARIGLTRWLTGKLVDMTLSEAYAAEAKGYELTPAAARSRAKETLGWISDLRTAALATHLPERPVIILSAAQSSLGSAKAHGDILAHHIQLALSTSRAEHRMVESGHNVLFEQPQSIVAAIDHLLDANPLSGTPPGI